jgi:hypothetical protein
MLSPSSLAMADMNTQAMKAGGGSNASSAGYSRHEEEMYDK